MKPKIASWRYQLGNRSLAINVNNSKNGDESSNKKHCGYVEDESSNTVEDEDDDDDLEPSEEAIIADIIQCLLEVLKDKDTVVR